MTCIVTLENIDINKTVEVGDEVLKMYGTNIYIEVGEKITIKERSTKIEQYSRQILSSYADILNNSSVAFQEEAKII